jgi:hypothetical protein
LLRLQGLEGGPVWCDAKDLAANAACLLLHHSPATTLQALLLRRGDAGRVPQECFVSVTSREPITLICSLEMAPQHPVPIVPAAPSAPRQVFVLCGPMCTGRSSIGRQLLYDFPDRFAPAPRLTVRKPHLSKIGSPVMAAPAEDTGMLTRSSVQPADAAGTIAQIGANAPGSEFVRFVSDQELAVLEQAGGMAESEAQLAVAGGTPVWALESAWAQGKAALVVAPLAAAVALKQLPSIEVGKGLTFSLLPACSGEC